MSLYLKNSAFDLLKIGIGPSSSHTLGPLNMARFFRKALLTSRKKISRIHVTLKGSLAHTGKGHLTPNALCAGLLGLDPLYAPIEEIQNASKRIKEAKGFHLAGQWIDTSTQHLITLNKTSRKFSHPNTAVFQAFNARGKLVFQRELCSIGGGDYVQVENLKPPLERPEKEKLSFGRILELCSEKDQTLIDWVYEQEELLTGQGRSSIHEQLNQLFEIMENCVDTGLSKEGLIPGKLGVRRRAKSTLIRLEENLSKFIGGSPLVSKSGIYALAVSEENACGGRIITAPTCGACGVLPGVLTLLHRDKGYSKESVFDGLLIAALIGNLVVDRASISGAEVGCQGEVGVACAMAAAAYCAMKGGTNHQVEEAAETALEHHLGLTCDPVMGLVQVPCIERNAVAAGTAMNSAILAFLGEGSHLISFDKCVDTMMLTGSDMSEKYKETSLGGLATTHC